MRTIERGINFAAVQDLAITLKMIFGGGKVGDRRPRNIPSCSSDADRVIRHLARVSRVQDQDKLKNFPAIRAEEKSVRFAG
jgi:hypothetical protein